MKRDGLDVSLTPATLTNQTMELEPEYPTHPLLSFPDDFDEADTVSDAIEPIWEVYVEQEQRIKIFLHGMAGTVDAFTEHLAIFEFGSLFWNDSWEESRIEVGTRDELAQKFLPWVLTRVKPFEDSGEFTFSVYSIFVEHDIEVLGPKYP